LDSADEADEAIQKIYALRKERDELLESMELLRNIGFPAIRQKKLSERLMHCAKSAINSAGLWNCLPKRPNAGFWARSCGNFVVTVYPLPSSTQRIRWSNRCPEVIGLKQELQ
jgi:hypothetical protein